MRTDPLLEDMLGLPEFEITDFQQDSRDMWFHVQVKERPEVCQQCGMYRPNMVVQKTRTQEIRDMNILGKHVTLVVKRRYFRCLECAGMFAEPLDCIEGKARLTTRLRQYIALRARYIPFVDIETECHVSDTTIRKVFLEDVRTLPAISDLDTPSILGIDEICLTKGDAQRKQAWAVIANGDNHTVMELLQDRSKKSVVALLNSLQKPKRVEVVTMDMWSGYRTAAHEVLPKALVVIDKFHVVRMASDQVDSIRRSLSRWGPCKLKKNKAVFLMHEAKLSDKGKALRDEWFDAYPELKTAYYLKESFYRLYDCPDKTTATKYYEDWRRSIPAGMNGFHMMCSTIRRSHNEIFNYFEAPHTNAFVEGLNRSIRLIADQGCGYDFEVLRGKVLFSAGKKRDMRESSR